QSDDTRVRSMAATQQTLPFRQGRSIWTLWNRRQRARYWDAVSRSPPAVAIVATAAWSSGLCVPLQIKDTGTRQFHAIPGDLAADLPSAPRRLKREKLRLAEHA